MGTIGHNTLLYDLKNWQIRAAIRGYYRQQRPHYESARLLGLWTVSCQRSKNAPALNLEDLVRFPWDRTVAAETYTEEDIAELQRMMREENERNKAKTPQQ